MRLYSRFFMKLMPNSWVYGKTDRFYRQKTLKILKKGEFTRKYR
jgi:hypothetical protein